MQVNFINPVSFKNRYFQWGPSADRPWEIPSLPQEGDILVSANFNPVRKYLDITEERYGMFDRNKSYKIYEDGSALYSTFQKSGVKYPKGTFSKVYEHAKANSPKYGGLISGDEAIILAEMISKCEEDYNSD